MWPAVPTFYGYDDACIYPLWAFYKALLVLVTPPAIDWLRRARDYEDRFLRTEVRVWACERVGVCACMPVRACGLSGCVYSSPPPPTHPPTPPPPHTHPSG